MPEYDCPVCLASTCICLSLSEIPASLARDSSFAFLLRLTCSLGVRSSAHSAAPLVLVSSLRYQTLGLGYPSIRIRPCCAASSSSSSSSPFRQQPNLLTTRLEMQKHRMVSLTGDLKLPSAQTHAVTRLLEPSHPWW